MSLAARNPHALLSWWHSTRSRDRTRVRDVFFSLDAGKLIPLERETAAIQGKTSGFIVMSTKASSEFPGAKSPVRFPSGETLDFVVKSVLIPSTVDPREGPLNTQTTVAARFEVRQNGSHEVSLWEAIRGYGYCSYRITADPYLSLWIQTDPLLAVEEARAKAANTTSPPGACMPRKATWRSMLQGYVPGAGNRQGPGIAE